VLNAITLAILLVLLLPAEIIMFCDVVAAACIILAFALALLVIVAGGRILLPSVEVSSVKELILMAGPAV